MIKPLKNTLIQQATATKTVAKLQYRLECLSSRLSNDDVIIEEPLQINLIWFNTKKAYYQHDELAVIMRTPGNDIELIVGFLFSEGVITNNADIISICVANDSPTNNILEVELAKSVLLDWTLLTRSFTSQSSCGVCGKTSIKSLALKSHKALNNNSQWLSIAAIPEYCQTLTSKQDLFISTGGVHAAGLINNNQWLSVQEDIGRHNAVDKIIGDIVLNNHVLEEAILLLTGRISFELMQKAVMVGISVVIAVGAPSSLAVDVAKQFDITLIGFTKNKQFNVYHGDYRLKSEHI